MVMDAFVIEYRGENRRDCATIEVKQNKPIMPLNQGIWCQNC